MGHVTENPTNDSRRLKAKHRGFPPWSIENLHQFRIHWPVGSKPCLARCPLLFTACRRSDVVLLGRQHVRDGWIEFGQAKTGERVDVGCCPAIAGFGDRFRAQCDAAGVSKNAHGLRKAAGSLLAEVGYTVNEIMPVLGHADERTTSIYIRSASLRTLAESAMKNHEEYGGVEMVNLESPTSRPCGGKWRKFQCFQRPISGLVGPEGKPIGTIQTPCIQWLRHSVTQRSVAPLCDSLEAIFALFALN
jgi:hypothetical protein